MVCPAPDSAPIACLSCLTWKIILQLSLVNPSCCHLGRYYVLGYACQAMSDNAAAAAVSHLVLTHMNGVVNAAM